MTTGFRGSPAARTFRGGEMILVRSAWISMRHTGGGAQMEVTPSVSMTDIISCALNRGELYRESVASPINWATKLDQGCCAHPGDATLRWMSPGSKPIQ